MGESLTEFLNNFISTIKGIIDYITGLVAYFRAENDGEDAELPELDL